MDTSIRFYNTNSRSRLSLQNKQQGHTRILLEATDGTGSGALEEDIDEDAMETELISPTSSSISAPAPQPEQVNIADFEDIFLRYQTPITNFIYHLIGNREQASDLAQDVFEKAYKALLGGTVVQPGALSAWLYRIAANTTTDTLRRKRIISWLPLSLFNEDRGIGAGVISTSGGASTENFTNTNDEYTNDTRAHAGSSLYERNGYDGGRFESRVADREIVELVFRQLPAKYASCLWLYENDGLSCADIAQVLNISSSAVKMRLMRARERFIALYKKEVGEE
jgi:RNA polymerase sigma-70 factor (ECF subfamily)